jgi:Tol biopolymer transport system component
LPGQPFAAESSAVRLGDAVRLKLSPQADRLDTVNPAHWLWSGNRLQRLVWSPQGDAFLMVEQRSDRTQQLWLASLDGSAPQPVNRGGSVYEYGWSPDSTFIVYTTPGEQQFWSSVREVTQLIVVKRTALQRPIARRAIVNTSLPSLTQQGIWYTQDGALWLMDYQTGASTRVTALPDLGRATDALPIHWPLAVSPDASRVAFACGDNLCLMNLDGSNRRVIPASGIRAITWDRTGARLAATSLDANNLGPVRMLIVSRDGEVQHTAEVAPRDATDPPQWTPEGRTVFVQTYPMNGRRILTVDADTSHVLDLSREHWDAYFALSPDGKNVLLNNGRGGFWLAPVIR